jgi:RNA polymerase-binding transcription factor DksA
VIGGARSRKHRLPLLAFDPAPTSPKPQPGWGKKSRLCDDFPHHQAFSRFEWFEAWNGAYTLVLIWKTNSNGVAPIDRRESMGEHRRSLVEWESPRLGRRFHRKSSRRQSMDLETVKQSLEARLTKLTTRVSKIESDLRKPGSKDWQDRATEKQNEEVLKQLSAAERAEIEDIRAALIRIREGTYTLCAKCGGEISPKRLEALPYTNSCITCAS